MNQNLAIKNAHVLTISLLALMVPITIIILSVCHQTDGAFIYPLDDTYIHLAIAKNIRFHQIWGISQQGFVSAASSIVYPILLSIFFFLFGAHTLTALFINITAGIALIVTIQKWLISKEIKPLAQLAIILTVIYLVPLPVLIISGMEHTLQFLFCFLFITTFSDRLALAKNQEFKEWSIPIWTYIWGALVVAVRYEGLMLIFGACLILLTHRKWILAFQLAIYATLPILAFGIFSLMMGNFFLPNSVILKSNTPELTIAGLYYFFSTDFWFRLFNSLIGYNTIVPQRLLLLLPIAYLISFRIQQRQTSYQYICILLMIAALAHISFTRYVRFPRYEAWLIGCSIVTIGAIMFRSQLKIVKKEIVYAAAIIIALLTIPFLIRSKNAFENITQSSVNIYDQQYQMARFFHQYYDSSAIALGDIGAVSYFTKGKKIDLVGLANIDIARSIKQNYNSPAFLDTLCKAEKVKIAVVYEIYTYPGLLKKWKKIATWQMPNNVICGDDIVSFYATEADESQTLRANLVAFQASLPQEIEVKYF